MLLSADFTSGENAHPDIYGNGSNRLYVFIADVVLYNVCYRDYLRAHGIDALIEHLCRQAPAFRSETKAIKALRDKVERCGPLADYDIQCLSTDDSFSVFGHRFSGLRDVRRSVERYHRNNGFDFDAKEYDKLDDIHILCDYEPYPIFDSYDLSDNRDYNNYFFLPCPFTSDEISLIDAMHTYGNNCKISEQLEGVKDMPLLYYKGDGPSMLLVTAK